MTHSKTIAICFFIIMLSGCVSSYTEKVYQNPDEICRKVNKKMSEKNLRRETPLKYYLNHYDYRLARFRHKDKAYLIRKLYQNHIQYIQYGDTATVIIPTDEYYEFNSERLNDIRYSGLNYMVNLLDLSPCSKVYVAAFSDDVGSKHFQNQLTQAQAESMLTFLWANLRPAELLRAQGMGARFPIADNQSIRGSAMNRHIEVQWLLSTDPTLNNITRAMK